MQAATFGLDNCADANQREDWRNQRHDMTKKKKFKLGSEVRRIARDRIQIPAKKVIPNKKRVALFADDDHFYSHGDADES